MTVKCSMDGNNFSMSKFKQPCGRIDCDYAAGEIDFVDDFFNGGDQVFPAAALNNIERAGSSRHGGLNNSDALTTDSENLEPHDLIMIVLAGRQHFESALRDRERGTDI